MASIDPGEEFLTIDELCAWLKIPKATIYKQRSDGNGPPAHRIGKHLRFMHSETLTWLAPKRDAK
jgi:excisionase family DNA binding protein